MVAPIEQGIVMAHQNNIFLTVSKFIFDASPCACYLLNSSFGDPGAATPAWSWSAA